MPFEKVDIKRILNDELKNICQLEHSRHRSFKNFISNMVSGLIAYSFFPKKPSIKSVKKHNDDRMNVAKPP